MSSLFLLDLVLQFSSSSLCDALAARNRLYNTGGFFLVAWLYHYLPFFTMSRQLFLHHYLPAHVLSCLVVGVVFHFLFCGDTLNYPVSIAGITTRRRPRQKAHVGKGMYIALTVVVGLLLANFAFLKPLTYGTPGLTADQVNQRRILSSWTLVSFTFTVPVLHFDESRVLTRDLVHPRTALCKVMHFCFG